jgi:hypothetical protein
MTRPVFSSSPFDMFKPSLHRFDGSSSDEEKEPLSPASQIQGIIRSESFEGDLEKEDGAALDQSLRGFSYPDSPRRKLLAHKVQETLAVFFEVLKMKPNTPEFHHAATAALKECSWALKIIAKMNAQSVRHPIPSELLRIIDLKHLVEGEMRKKAPVGLHFCPPGSAARALVSQLQTHPLTGVMHGKVQLATGATKFSSIFPDSIRTEKELIAAIEGGKELARKGNVVFLQSIPQFLFIMR